MGGEVTSLFLATQVRFPPGPVGGAGVVSRKKRFLAPSLIKFGFVSAFFTLNHHVLLLARSILSLEQVADRHPAGVNQPANLHEQGQPKDGKRMNESNQLALLELPTKERRPKPLFNPMEFKIQALRECPTPAEMQLCDTPDKAADYRRNHVVTHPYYNRDVESSVILLVNTRRKIMGHCLIPTGTLDTILVHQREAFRPAVIGAAAALCFT